ncbi:hypothetical protein DW322_21250 [Rhodococcus rhodnii]|uniref:Resolvase HTH domain-containing protein n=2 Tax=Rhodococcus rhodnii TaxID=38312 RepID=R7WR31_9NOCA|nr:hypothetical protein [Rhodococcus rhodnii]EOM77766.1 hypothetical protein Rrhod_0834 [Rhodococcus rhodnii LMG 5362]TXG92227.1 hypothetical protein DW322_21250 [Rhodococcus rhodnii]
MIDAATVARWQAWRAAGATFREIARAARVSDKTVRKALAGVSPPVRRGPQKRPISVDDVCTLIDQGHSWTETAQLLGCSRTLVMARLHEAGRVANPDTRPRKNRYH